MEIDYGNRRLKKQLSNASEIKMAFGNQAKKIAQRLDDIQASPNLAVLIQIPAANCHILKGDRKGEWALDISPNFRMIFEINHDPIPYNEDESINTKEVTAIKITEITDYH